MHLIHTHIITREPTVKQLRLIEPEFVFYAALESLRLRDVSLTSQHGTLEVALDWFWGLRKFSISYQQQVLLEAVVATNLEEVVALESFLDCVSTLTGFPRPARENTGIVPRCAVIPVGNSASHECFGSAQYVLQSLLSALLLPVKDGAVPWQRN